MNKYFEENLRSPTERDITAGTGIPITSVHRMLGEMSDEGLISFEGRRGLYTDKWDQYDAKKTGQICGYVQCGPGEVEEQENLGYIHLSEKLVGKEEFYVLIAKGDSMTGAGVYPGDYVIIRKQETANYDDIVVALLDGKNNLKKYVKGEKTPILRSLNDNYEDIIPEAESELQIQGVAIGVYHRLKE